MRGPFSAASPFSSIFDGRVLEVPEPVPEGPLTYTPSDGDVGEVWFPEFRAPVDPADELTYSSGKLTWPGTQGPNNGQKEMYRLERIGDTFLSALSDGDVTLRFIHTQSPGNCGIGLRGSGGVDSENVYWLYSQPGNPLRMFKWVGGAQTELGAGQGASGISPTTNVEYTMRFRAEGSDLKAKIWASADEEPADWLIETTDSSLTTGGWVGIVRPHSRQSEVYGMTVEFIGDQAPLLIANAPQFWTLTAPVGEASQSIDFSGVIAGDTTALTLSGTSVPAHSWSGKVLTVNAASTLAAADFTVSAVNGALSQIGGDAYINIEAVAAPATLAADTTNLDTSMDVEVDRPYPVTDFSQHHSFGLWPYSYTVVTKPSWINVEHNGVAWGIAPSTPASSEAITVRVTDARGTTRDLTTNVVVIAARSRSGTTIPTGNDIPTYLDANSAAPGSVWELEASGSYTWLDRSLVPAGTQSNPIIVSGPASAVVDTSDASGPFSGSPVGSYAGGLITEGFSIRPVSSTTNTSIACGIANSSAGSHCYHYDHALEGWESVEDPNDGQLWEISTGPESIYAYNGNCLSTTGRHIIFDGCTIQRMRTAFTNSVGQHEGGAFNITASRYRQDAGVTGRCDGLVLHKISVGAPEGNYLDSEHQDLWQLFSEISPPCRNVIWDNCFFSCESRDQNVQGIHADHDAWFHDDILDYTNLTERPIIRDTVVLTSSQVGLLHERFYDAKLDGGVILAHPDSTEQNTNIRMRAPSQIDVRNTICNSVGPARMEWRGLYSSSDGPGWRSIIDETNNEELTLSGETITNIFPNWNNTGLSYEDPREAVAASQAASAARFWIDPAGAWHLAHPNIGPSWLRDGIG